MAGHVAAIMGIAHAVARSWEEGATGPGKYHIQPLTGVTGDAPPLGIVHCLRGPPAGSMPPTTSNLNRK